MSPTTQTAPHINLRTGRTSPRWFALPVVREVPAPPPQVGSAW